MISFYKTLIISSIAFVKGVMIYKFDIYFLNGRWNLIFSVYVCNFTAQDESKTMSGIKK